MATPRPERLGQRVRVVRDRQGRVVGFQDPDKRNIFIRRVDAVPRLRYSVERSQVEDSFGNRVGVGALGLPLRGYDVAFKVKEAAYRPLAIDPLSFRPNPDQELIEKTTYTTKDGKLVTSEMSYGLGEKYDPSKTGRKWRHEASKALGRPEGERLPTRDLKRAVLYKEFIVKTTTG